MEKSLDFSTKNQGILDSFLWVSGDFHSFAGNLQPGQAQDFGCTGRRSVL